MRSEYGRSLIEIMGVMAIGAVMTVSAVTAYRMIRQSQARTIADAELAQTAKNVKILMELRGDYSGVSVDYLTKAGALKNPRAPIGNQWSVAAVRDGTAFAINLEGLSRSDCQYFAAAPHAWASAIVVNGYETQPDDHCFSSATNQISFIVE